LSEVKNETADWNGFSNPQFTIRERSIYETIISDQLVSVVVFMRMRGVSVRRDEENRYCSQDGVNYLIFPFQLACRPDIILIQAIAGKCFCVLKWKSKSSQEIKS
jgi:hypothetical protein